MEHDELHLDDTLITEPLDAPNAAIALSFRAARQWRGVGDPRRSTASVDGGQE